MDEIDFGVIEEVILVVEGEELIFRNPASFPELGLRLAALATKKRTAARSRVVDDPPKSERTRRTPPREPEDDYLDEDEEDEGDLYEAPKPAKSSKKAKSKKSITHVPGGKSKMNLKVNVPSGNIRDAAEKLKAQARAATKGEMFKD